jgi:hypothetical protein
MSGHLGQASTQGMSGTVNMGSIQVLLTVVLYAMRDGDVPFSFVDVGAGSGVVLALAFAYGSVLC